MKNIKIGSTDIILEDLGVNQGKIIVSDISLGYVFQMQWGAMGGTISEFICKINSDYFTTKLLSGYGEVVNIRKTFANLRKYIREEINLPWYQHLEFQAQMRETLNAFQKQCKENPSNEYFVNNFYKKFSEKLEFNLFEHWQDANFYESEFWIDEPWHFLEYKEGPQIIWLKKLHGKLVRRLGKI